MGEPRIENAHPSLRTSMVIEGPLWFWDADGECFQVGLDNTGHLEVMCRPNSKLRQRRMVLQPHVSNVVIIKTVEDQ